MMLKVDNVRFQTSYFSLLVELELRKLLNCLCNVSDNVKNVFVSSLCVGMVY